MNEALMGRPAKKRRPAWLFPVLLFAQFAALLLLFELALAWFHPVTFRRPLGDIPGNVWSSVLHRRASAPGLKYELTPGKSAEIRGVLVSINSLGIRGPEISAKKPPGTIRIVAMGASVAFGWTVTAEDAYPGNLERRLNERARGTDRRYEVLNFGVGGYATRDEVAAFEAKALPLDPDLVILDFHPNGPESEPIQPLHQVFHEPLWWEKWNVLRLLAYGRREWGIWTLGGGSEYHYLANPKGPHWPTLLAAYDKLQKLCEEHHLPVIVAIFPTYGAPPEWKDYPFGDIHRQVQETATKRGFQFVDMLPVFAASPYNVPAIAADLEHPNAIGLDLAAAALEKKILENHEAYFHAPAPSAATKNGDAPR